MAVKRGKIASKMTALPVHNRPSLVSRRARACLSACVLYVPPCATRNRRMGSINRIGTTVMIPVGFLERFDDFAEERGTDRSEEARVAYRNHIEDPPGVDEVLSRNAALDVDGIPRPHVKVMLNPDLLRKGAEFREERETSRSPEFCVAMEAHIEDPPPVADVTDDPAARLRAQTTEAERRGVSDE